MEVVSERRDTAAVVRKCIVVGDCDVAEGRSVVLLLGLIRIGGWLCSFL